MRHHLGSVEVEAFEHLAIGLAAGPRDRDLQAAVLGPRRGEERAVPEGDMMES